jgi:hypothetical protein
MMGLVMRGRVDGLEYSLRSIRKAVFFLVFLGSK